MQRIDLFGAAAAFETVRMPDGTEAAIPTEHAAVIYVNEQPAFRVVCTPQLLPQLALGRLLTEGWIASAEEVEQIAVCAEGLKVNIYLNHPLTARRAAAQEVSSCCTDNVALGSPVEVQPLRAVPHLDLQPEWVDALAAAMSAGLPLYQATHAVHSCFVLHEGRILCACEDIGRHNALDKAVGSVLLAGVPLSECVLYTSDGYGAQSHPGRRSGTGQQDHAHRPVAGAGRRIRLTAALRPETSADIVKKCGVTSVRVDLLPARMIIY